MEKSSNLNVRIPPGEHCLTPSVVATMRENKMEIFISIFCFHGLTSSVVISLFCYEIELFVLFIRFIGDCPLREMLTLTESCMLKQLSLSLQLSTLKENNGKLC